jgi:hypothetical protein
LIALRSHIRRHESQTYHAGVGANGDQNIACAILDVEEKKKLSQTSLPLSSGSTLTWIGFSEAGM